MKIDPIFKVREITGLKVILVQGKNPGDLSRVVSLNETSLYLWDNLHDKEFELDDVVRLLTDRFEVDDAVARNDATIWVNTFKENGIIV